MYKKRASSWVRHLDFYVLDTLVVQISLIIAYWLRHGNPNPYGSELYRKGAIGLFGIHLLMYMFMGSFHNVMRRGYFKEFVETLKQAFIGGAFASMAMFYTKSGEEFSRTVLLSTCGIYVILSYCMRTLWKKVLKRRNHFVEQKKLLLITDSTRAEAAIENFRKHNYMGFDIIGIALTDKTFTETEPSAILDVPVIADMTSVSDYVCHNWVDEIMVDLVDPSGIDSKILNDFHKMGIILHMSIHGTHEQFARKQSVEVIGDQPVLTSCVVMVTRRQLFLKRCLDILGGIVGSLITILLTIILGPIIFLKSPGPIFFKQTRIGQNGKTFKIFKFRSMYMDAEERKKQLMEQNEMNGLMFKMENDPRIIKGIGHFIRKWSLDEFPQFFNVLLGDMSLVGTRPPTVDEWEQYAPNHRIRMVIRPGITGMWQVSGRSDIKDFDEVVKLDEEYINDWNLGKDIKILLLTVKAVFKSSGAM